MNIPLLALIHSRYQEIHTKICLKAVIRVAAKIHVFKQQYLEFLFSVFGMAR